MTSITGLSVTLSVVALLGYLLVLVDGFIGLGESVLIQHTPLRFGCVYEYE